MKEWFTIAELAAANLPGLPRAEGSYRKLLATKWRKQENLVRKVNGATRPVTECHIALLSPEAKARLIAMYGALELAPCHAEEQRKHDAWARFEKLTKDHKAICEARLKALQYADDLRKGGLTVHEAIIIASKRFGFSRASLFNWKQMTEGYDRSDWLAALAPSFSTCGRQKNDCHAEAWDTLVSDYLRPSGPAFSACYRRMQAAAKKHGWSPIPSERALRRRLDTEVQKAVQTLARAGKDKAKTLYPAQRRDRSMLHAMEAVNMDGHKLDVFVQVPWTDKPVRLYLIAIQDLYSGKVLSWRLSDAETWEIVRLVIGDMVEQYGIPDKITLDNGRAFASKWISGGTRNRFRFKVKDDDPRGLLTTLGVEQQWTTPYSGQSKPLERTWRDLAETISKHPLCAGAYTGNKPDAKPEDYGRRAIPFEEFKAHVAGQIEAVNAQTGRRAANCQGRSFDETFSASIAEPSTIIRHATAAQRSLWLLASDVIRARKGSGEIHFHGNRYWNKALNQYAGQKVTIRFDPDNLHKPVRVYDLNNALICVADCISDAGFYDAEAARLHSRARKDYVKAVQAQKDATARLSPEKLADIYGRAKRAEQPAKPVRRPRIPRIVTGNLAVKHEPEIMSEEDMEASFSRAMRRIASSDIIPFPKGK